MSFTRDGYSIMALSGTLAIGVIAASAWRRSWVLWLLGFVLLALSLCVAWYHRTPAAAPTVVPSSVMERPV